MNVKSSYFDSILPFFPYLLPREAVYADRRHECAPVHFAP